jgi:OmpA-OmpF porin, OOP family
MGNFMDSRKLVCFTLLASAVSVSHADGFFVNTNFGVDKYYPQYENEYVTNGPLPSSTHTHAEALRVGYRWTTGAFSYGLETGYVNMGPTYADFYDPMNGPDVFTHYEERIDGVVLGPTLKYDLPMGFFVSARGGFFRSTDHQMERVSFEPQLFDLPFTPFSDEYRADISGIGSYVGLGVGYDFNQSFGLSLNCDRYRPHVGLETNWWEHGELFIGTPKVLTYSVTAEYRF